MTRMTARAGRTIAAAIGAIALAGCHFAVVPPKTTASPKPTASSGAAGSAGATTSPSAASVPAADAPMQRLADAPALLVQCAIDRAGLRPAAGQDWIAGGKVSINTTNAADFNEWWRAHDTPGPYPETFVIDGHRTHYLSFGATWITKDGQWVPQHTGHTDPVAESESLYGWATWAALNNKLPPAVCGTSVTAQQLQAQVYGSGVASPWTT
jgi:hypothetical protein